jgi:hypothetical protein
LRGQGRRRRTLLAAAIITAIIVLPASVALAADAHLELLVRVLPGGSVESSCLIELVELPPNSAQLQAMAADLTAAGLSVTTATGDGRWLITIAGPAPQPGLPAVLADGVIVRTEARRWGPVTVWRTYLTIGGPGGFLAQLRGALSAALPGVAEALGSLPPAVGGGLNLPSAVRLQVPGRVAESSAPAKAGDALHWDVRLDSDAVVLADVTSFAVAPASLGLWLVGGVLVAAALWAVGDVAIRATRARHGSRNG